MLLKPDISLIEFLHTADTCSGEIYFRTAAGDNLNLKSELAKYLFVTLTTSDNISVLKSGEIYCDDANDYQKLKKFLIID